MSIWLDLKRRVKRAVSESESDLIELAQSGDGDAFCLLARGYERRIYTLALHYCCNAQDAEDLSQEVWLKAFRAIGSFRGEASFYTWLRQIMINAFLNHQRKRSLRWKAETVAIKMMDLDSAEYANGWSLPQGYDLEDDIFKRILVERVMQALGELTPQQRLIFLLKHREAMTYEEISRAVGCSTGTIKKSLFRSVVKLRQHLGINAHSADYAACAAGDSC